MRDFRVNITVEVDQVANALAIRTPVPLQLVRRAGQWQATCEPLRFESPPADTMEDAVLAGARQAALEIQATVEDRPLIVGRITPCDVPQGMF